MPVTLDDLRRRVTERALTIVGVAADQLVADLYTAAGTGLPEGSIQATVTATADNAIAVGIALVGVAADPATTVWEWTVGEPSRPYDPHQRLDGVTFDQGSWPDVLASGGEFGQPWYYPGDHDGCQCSVDVVVGDLEFDPVALAAEPVQVRAFGQTILVTPAAPSRTGQAAPDWWSTVLTAQNWSAAVAAAQGG